MNDFRDFARRLALVTVVVVLLWFVVMAAQPLFLVFGGILLAVLLRAISSFVEAHTFLKGRWALLLVVLLLTGIFALAGYLLAPRVSQQVQQLGDTLPRSFESLQQSAAQYEWAQSLTRFLNDFDAYLPQAQEIVRRVAGVFSTAFGALTAFAFIIFIGLCLAIEPRTYTSALIALIPKPHRERGREILRDLQRILGFWLVAKLASMTIVGVLTALGLWLLGMPLVFALAFIAALLAFIPNIGPILSAVPAVLLGFTLSPATALYVALLYTGIQTLESYFITPFIERETVSLPPALTATVQLVLGLIIGIIGVMLAAPLTAVAIVLTQRIYVHDLLGDRKTEGPAGL